MEIREAQIEDILVDAPELTKKILNLDEMPFLLSRQMLSFLADLIFSTLIKQSSLKLA